MADTSDVQNALAALVAAVLYPAWVSGVGGWDVSASGGWGAGLAYGNPTVQTLSIAGLPVRVYRGWPVAQQLDPDLADGVAHVTILEERGGGRLATGRLHNRRSFRGEAPTIQATVAGAVVTIAGTATAGNLVGVQVDGKRAVYAVQPGDTALSVAQGLAAQFPASGVALEGGGVLTGDDGSPITVSETGIAGGSGSAATITFATTAPIIARVGSMGQSVKYPRHQTQIYRLTCWAPNPMARDAICSAVDAQLSDINWLQLPDQKAWMIWAGTRTDDTTTKAAIWRRDIMFNVTWWTSITQSVAPVLFPQIILTGGNGSAVPVPS